MQPKSDAETELLLQSARTVAELIATTLGPFCEVAVHDLRNPTASLVHLVNGHISGRKTGSPIRDLLLKVIPEITPGSDVVGTYATDLPDGRRLKSATSIMRDSDGHPRVALCINIDISKLRVGINALDSLTKIDDDSAEDFAERTARDVPHALDVMHGLVENVIAQVGPLESISVKERIRAVSFLDSKGGFLIKGSVPVVAKALAVSEQTVYRYIELARSANPSGEPN